MLNLPIVDQNLNSIKTSYESLPAPVRRELLKKISSSQRKNLIDICKNENPKKNIESLNKAISQIKTQSLEIIKEDDRRLKNASLIRFFNGIAKVVRVIGEFFAKLFGNYLSPQDAAKKLETEYPLRMSMLMDKIKNPIIADLALKPATKEDLEDLFKSLQNNEKRVNLVDLLREKGFSPILSKIKLDKTLSMKKLDIEGIIFDRCELEYCHFSGSHLKNTHFYQCKIQNSSFLNSKLEDCIIQDCELRELVMAGAELTKVVFNRSFLVGCNFEDTKLLNSSFSKVSMPGTHFLQADVKDCEIINSNLVNTVFFNNETGFDIDPKTEQTMQVTKPLSVMLIHPENRQVASPKIYMKLGNAANTIPLRINFLPALVDKLTLNNEVNQCLSEIVNDKKNEKSPAAVLMERINESVEAEQPELLACKLILEKVRKLSSHVHAIVIPGGEDLPPMLYGEEPDKLTNWGDDYRRSILELALIKESIKRGIPLMGICRGFQLVNVYFGAKLTQHVDGQRGNQKQLGIQREYNGLIGGIVGESISSIVDHHQVVTLEKAPNEYLEPMALHKEYIKAVEPKLGGAAPGVFLQFHPEFLNAFTADSLKLEIVHGLVTPGMSKENAQFWTVLGDSAVTYKRKKDIVGKIALQRDK